MYRCITMFNSTNLLFWLISYCHLEDGDPGQTDVVKGDGVLERVCGTLATLGVVSVPVDAGRRRRRQVESREVGREVQQVESDERSQSFVTLDAVDGGTWNLVASRHSAVTRSATNEVRLVTRVLPHVKRRHFEPAKYTAVILLTHLLTYLRPQPTRRTSWKLVANPVGNPGFQLVSN